MKKLNAFLVSVLATAALNAAVIEQVIVRQQWPWSTDIKVEYKLSGVTSPVDISVRAYNGTAELPLPAAAIKGNLEGVTEDGVGQFTIDPVAAFGTEKIALANFKVKLSVSDTVLYKVFDLRTVGAEVQELTAADIRSGDYGTYFEGDYSSIIPGSTVGNVFIWTGVTNDQYRTTHLVMRRVFAKGRSFRMGTAAANHQVSFTNDFYMAVFPVTVCQRELIFGSAAVLTEDGMKPKSNIQWRSIRGEYYTNGHSGWWPTPGVWSADGFVPDYTKSPHEVGNESYIVLYFLRYRTGRLATALFDLATEAKWEYACRAGTQTATYAGDATEAVIDRIAWYDNNSGGVAHVVGQKAPNPWGIYDMLGNVYEWCLDIYSATLPTEAVVDPVGPESTNRYATRVARGGSYGNAFSAAVPTSRVSQSPHTDPGAACGGFRPIFDVP